MRSNVHTYHKEVKHNSRPGVSCYARVAQPNLPTKGIKSCLLPTRINNIYLAFSQQEAKTSPNLGSFSAPVLHLLAIRYHSRPHGGDYCLQIRGTFNNFWPGSKYASCWPGSKGGDKSSIDGDNTESPRTVYLPRAPYRRPTPSLSMLTVKGEGIICVFVPVFVIDGDLIADFNDVGWTEAWETPPRHRYLGKSPCHIGPTLLHPMVRITRGTVKHELTWFLIPYDTGGGWGWGYLNVHEFFQCS